jgi:hypothetical protein
LEITGEPASLPLPTILEREAPSAGESATASEAASLAHHAEEDLRVDASGHTRAAATAEHVGHVH